MNCSLWTSAIKLHGVVNALWIIAWFIKKKMNPCDQMITKIHFFFYLYRFYLYRFWIFKLKLFYKEHFLNVFFLLNIYILRNKKCKSNIKIYWKISFKIGISVIVTSTDINCYCFIQWRKVIMVPSSLNNSFFKKLKKLEAVLHSIYLYIIMLLLILIH